MAETVAENDDTLPKAGPSRPRYRRGPLLSMVVTLLSAGMMTWFMPDFLYVFEMGKPVDLGDATGLNLKKLKNNSYVRMQGYAWTANAVSFEKGVKWIAMTRSRYALVPLMGQEKMLVQYRLNPGKDVWNGLPGVFEGRLVRVDKAGLSYRKILEFISANRNIAVADDAWILFNGEAPLDKLWVLLVEPLFLLFILVNLRALYYYIRLNRKLAR